NLPRDGASPRLPLDDAESRVSVLASQPTKGGDPCSVRCSAETPTRCLEHERWSSLCRLCEDQVRETTGWRYARSRGRPSGRPFSVPPRPVAGRRPCASAAKQTHSPETIRPGAKHGDTEARSGD